MSSINPKLKITINNNNSKSVHEVDIGCTGSDLEQYIKVSICLFKYRIILMPIIL